jgi:glycosyltransferase involved in cell wall biosynthesis
MSKISIAIPAWECHGRGIELLDDLLRTIEIQTFKDFQVVISDHCSDRFLCDKIGEFVEKFDIKWIQNPLNRGNSPANLNHALQYCHGEIVKIMFQDDFFYDDEALEKIYNSLIDSEESWLLHGTNHTRDDGHTFYWDLYPKFNKDLLRGVNSISSPSVVAFKKDCTVKFDESLKYLMDVEYYYSMREKFGNPIFLEDVLVTNRFPHSHSITSNITNLEELLEKETKYCLEKYGVDE